MADQEQSREQGRVTPQRSLTTLGWKLSPPSPGSGQARPIAGRRMTTTPTIPINGTLAKPNPRSLLQRSRRSLRLSPRPSLRRKIRPRLPRRFGPASHVPTDTSLSPTHLSARSVETPVGYQNHPGAHDQRRRDPRFLQQAHLLFAPPSLEDQPPSLMERPDAACCHGLLGW